MKRKVPFIILVDIDDTLVHAKWRDQYMPTRIDGGIVNPSDWDLYNAKSIGDYAVSSMRSLISTIVMIHQYELWAVTSRPEKWRTLTEARLSELGIMPFDLLLMRPNEEVTVPSPILKPALVTRALQRRYEADYTKMSDYVLLVLDDRLDVCEAFRALGIVALQVHVPEETR